MLLRPEFWARIKQTRVVRITLLYIVLAWGAFLVIEKLSQVLKLSESIPQITLAVLAVGLLVVAFTAWAYAGEELASVSGWRWPAQLQRLARGRGFTWVLGGALGARRSYERFLAYWADAGPEVQPLIRETRGRLAQLDAGR